MFLNLLFIFDFNIYKFDMIYKFGGLYVDLDEVFFSFVYLFMSPASHKCEKI